jgi:hypothetical protein
MLELHDLRLEPNVDKHLQPLGTRKKTFDVPTVSHIFS